MKIFKSTHLYLGISILYFIRGAYLPYFFPLYEHLSTLNYNQISVLMSSFLFIQAIIPPIIGSLHTSRKIAWHIAFLCLIFFLAGLVTLFFQPNFIFCFFSALMIGFALIALKNILCVIMVEEIDSNHLRTAVAIRTTGMNIGSFIGNISALTIIGYFGSTAHLIFLLLGVCLLSSLVYESMSTHNQSPSLNIFPTIPLHQQAITFFKQFIQKSTEPWKNKLFIKETIILFAIVTPDGCWGTIIPKYLIDLYHSNDPLAFIYTISLITILLFSYSLNGWISHYAYKKGWTLNNLKWIAWVLFLIGLFCFSFSRSTFFLGLAVFLIILAEIVITPCFDEAAKKHAKNTTIIGAYYGVLNLFDGLARIIGASISLFLYGYLKGTWTFAYFWPLVGLTFIIILFACVIVASRISARYTLHT